MRFLILEKNNLKLEIKKEYSNKNLFYCINPSTKEEYIINPLKIPCHLEIQDKK